MSDNTELIRKAVPVKTMAEVLRETMRDHRVLWEIGVELVAKCESCGYLSTELETWEHQSNVASEVLEAAGYGPVREAQATMLRDIVDDYSVNLTVMSGPRIRDWLRARADRLASR